MDDLTASLVREGIKERVIDIVRSELEQLTKRMNELGMTADYRITEHYGVVEFNIIIQKRDLQKIVVTRSITAELMTGRSHTVAAVQRDLEKVVEMLFFEKEVLS